MKQTLLAVLLISILASGCSSQPEAEDDLVSARKAYVERQYLEAERLYERYLKIHQQSAERWEVWNKLYELAYNVRNNSQDAMELLEAMFLEFGDQAGRAKDILYRLGTLCMDTRNMDKAIEVWQRLLNLPESTPVDQAKAYRNIGEAYLYTGDYDLAIDALRACVELKVNDLEHARCLFDLAQTQFYLENYHAAEKTLEQVIQTPNMDEELHALVVLLLSDVYDQLGKTKQSIVLLESILHTYPNPMAIEKRLEYLHQRVK